MGDQKYPSPSEAVKNIVLVGRTGNGKSATGNSLIGKNVFASQTKAKGVTIACQAHTIITPSGSKIKIIDTPGLFDLPKSAENLSKQIMNCLKLAEGGLHVVVLVLSVRTRFTQEELNTLSTLLVHFGNEILNYTLVLFTGGDELEAEHRTLDDYIHKSPDIFKTILGMCGDRRVMFDNMTSLEDKKAKQVEQFFSLVAKIEESTNGNPYKGPMHPQIKEETERLWQQQMAIKAKNLGEVEFAEQNRLLQMSYNQMEDRTKDNLEKLVCTLITSLDEAQRENILLYEKNAAQENKRALQQNRVAKAGVLLAVPAVIDLAIKSACCIL